MSWRDPHWKYIPSSVHDASSEYLRAKFKRLRRELEAQKKKPENVAPFKRKKEQA